MKRKNAAQPAVSGNSRTSANRNTSSGKTGTRSTTQKRIKQNTGMQSDQNLLEELFMDELKDIYWAEKHLTKALPKMGKASASATLREAFERHLRVTEGQIKRLDKVFQLLGVPAKAKKCESMEGMVSESQHLMGELPKGTSARDAGLIISAQKIEHYEIAAYGSLAQLAKTIGRQDIATILQQTLEEEKKADEKLSEIAENEINIRAAQEEA